MADPACCRERWQRHFASLLVGAPTTCVSLLRQAASASESAFRELARSQEIDICTVPSHGALVRRHASRRLFKAHGEDGLPPQVYRRFAHLTARALLPVMVKASLRLEEPLAWRGSFIAELWKAKGSPMKCSSYRDISIADTAAKDFHGHLRSVLLPSLEQFSRPTQVGGLMHKGTDFGVHVGRLHWEYARQQNLSAAQIYVDLVAAFASTARELVYCPDRSPESLAAIAARLKLDPGSVQEFLAQASLPSALQQASVGAHLRSLIRMAHEPSWFTTQGLESPASSTRGSKAGDPLGDIFSCLS